MIQKRHQKMTFPRKALSKRTSTMRVSEMSGACASMPKNACRVTWRKGTDITTSWKSAEKRNTTMVAAPLDTPEFTSG